MRDEDWQILKAKLTNRVLYGLWAPYFKCRPLTCLVCPPELRVEKESIAIQICTGCYGDMTACPGGGFDFVHNWRTA